MMGAEIDEKAVLTYVSSLYRALPSVPPQTRLQGEQVFDQITSLFSLLRRHFYEFYAI